MISATYSPEDNKLRLYASTRLDAETYARVKAAGYKWAPRQELFVAPMWTPGREDIAIELAGDIDDEDKSLVERQEERADRFDEYSDNRRGDAEAAHKAVAAIADNIPFGQPILVGHHSEKRARRDAKRIDDGMRKTIRMWETAEYWQQRAAGALRHAKYKELPSVRARRIKTIEADKRKSEKINKEAELFIKLWQDIDRPGAFKKDGETLSMMDSALFVANRSSHISKSFSLADYPRDPPASLYEGPMSLWSALTDGIITPEQARDIAIPSYGRGIPYRARWIAHYELRLMYERAMLADGGGTVADKTGPEKGGACKCWCSPGYGRGWSIIQKVNKVSVTVLDNWGNGGRDFTRTIPFDKLTAIMTKAEVDTAKAEGRYLDAPDKIGAGFYLREGNETRAETRDEAKDRTHREHVAAAEAAPAVAAADIAAMRDRLKQGIKVVAVRHLFATPPQVAGRAVELADIKPGHRVLEPNGGTGRLLEPMFNSDGTAWVMGDTGSLTVIEINSELAKALRRQYVAADVRQGDFLESTVEELGSFDRIVMNPPFDHGADIRHIEHALAMLKPGGRLVAICGNGPRQHAKLRELSSHWEELPAGTFEGTGVSAVLLVIDAPAIEAAEPVTEPTDQGEQILVPGVAPIANTARLQERIAAPMRPKKAQQPPNTGLFDLDARSQTDLF